jgi:uncharacterized protein with FMN-binding domain
MRRAPFVVVATGAGMGLLMSYHIQPLTPGSAPKPVGVASGASSTTTAPPSTTTGPATAVPPGAVPTTTAPAPTTSTTATSRTATGQDIQYRYGDIQLSVTETGTKIDDVRVAAEGATDARSEQINSQAVPMLIEQAMDAQSANIDGVSGATFTSQAFQQALQSALSQS